MNRLSILIVLVMSYQLSSAQEQRFHFGLKVIPSMAWIKSDTKSAERDGRSIGFGYGVQTEFKIQENYAISTGVQVNYRGGSLKHTIPANGTVPEAVTTVDYNLQYVEVPFTLKMMTNEFNKIRYYGQFGFSPGIAIRAKSDPEAMPDDDDFMDYTNMMNLNMIVGAGVHYTISGSTVLFAGLEFNNGFLNVFDKETANLPWSPDVKLKGVTNYFGLSTGILF
ncbi:MAG: hypothetical protein RLZZ630_1581 [Bacteroidota bacterium]|jgi:hypothetical protein